MKILKAILLISALLGVALRLFAYENAAFLGEENAKILNLLAFAAMGVCIVCALIWVAVLKKEEKAVKEESQKENADEE